MAVVRRSTTHASPTGHNITYSRDLPAEHGASPDTGCASEPCSVEGVLSIMSGSP
ncbi:hypothetical protein JCM33774_81600 [Actinophytocola sp. KF-1]